jgi:hypothetical protein
MPNQIDVPMPDIPLTPVKSNQVAAIGYDPVTKTLAVTFTSGTAVYHYPNVEPKVHADFMAAESIGRFFGAHIKALPFTKYMPPAEPEKAAAAPGSRGTVPWPFPSQQG